MPRASLVVCLMGLALTSARLDGQSPLDFSGKWTMVPGSPSVYPPERELTIAQDATTLTIDSTGLSVTIATGPSGTRTSEVRYPMRVTYALDGIEHPTRVVANRPSSLRATYGMRSWVEESISRATWAGRQLIIMTYERRATRRTGRDGTVSDVVTRRTLRNALSLDADGRLVWETLIVADPMPGGREVTTPTPHTRVFTKG